MITKTADDISHFSHSTSAENLDKILSSGRLHSLKRLSELDPEVLVNVEPNRWNRQRDTMQTSEAAKLMDGVKATNRLFLIRDAVLPSYGNYSIVKKLKSPKAHSAINLIPDEHTIGRSLSVKSNSQIYIPDEEYEDWIERHPNYRKNFRRLSEMELPKKSKLDGLYQLPGKTLQNLKEKMAEEKPILEYTPSQLKRAFGLRAHFTGSRGLGLDIGAQSDIDIFVPYKTKQHYERAIARLLAKYPEMNSSPYNKNRNDAHVMSGKINEEDVDISVSFGQRGMSRLDSFDNANRVLSDESREKIRNTKSKLKNAWILPEYRYKRYKRKLDDKLNIVRL